MKDGHKSSLRRLSQFFQSTAWPHEISGAGVQQPFRNCFEQGHERFAQKIS